MLVKSLSVAIFILSKYFSDIFFSRHLIDGSSPGTNSNRGWRIGWAKRRGEKNVVKKLFPSLSPVMWNRTISDSYSFSDRLKRTFLSLSLSLFPRAQERSPHSKQPSLFFYPLKSSAERERELEITDNFLPDKITEFSGEKSNLGIIFTAFHLFLFFR